jgi:CHASE3 domain sensor protein
MTVERWSPHEENLPMFANQTILKKGLLLVSVPLLFQLSFIGVVALMDREVNKADEWFVHTKDVIRQAQVVLTKLVDSETGTRGFIVTGDPVFTEPYDQASQDVPTGLQQLESLVSDNPEQQARVRQIAVKGGKLMEVHAENIRLVREGAREEAVNRVKARLGKSLMDDLRKSIEAFMAEENRLDQQREQAVQLQRQRLFWLLVGGMAASLLGTVVLAFAFSRGISGRLAILTENVHRFGKDEALVPPITGGDEIAQVDQAFRGMVQERQRAEDRFRFAVEAAPSGMVAINERGQIVLVNKQDEGTLRLLP